MKRPATGLPVHYVSHGTPIRPDGTQEHTKQCRAATITEVYWQTSHLHSGEPGNPGVQDGPPRLSPDGRVSLAVLNPTGLFFSQGIPYDDGFDPFGSDTGLCHGHEYEGGTWHWPAIEAGE